MQEHERRLVGAEYVSSALDLSRASAYRVIRDLNRELEASGVRTLPGKVNLAYLERRFFSMPDERGASVTDATGEGDGDVGQ